MITLAEFKQQNPAYAEWDDADLGRALYEKFYAGKMPFEDFAKKTQVPGAVEVGGLRAGGRGFARSLVDTARVLSLLPAVREGVDDVVTGLVTGNEPLKAAPRASSWKERVIDPLAKVSEGLQEQPHEKYTAAAKILDPVGYVAGIVPQAMATFGAGAATGVGRAGLGAFFASGARAAVPLATRDTTLRAMDLADKGASPETIARSVAVNAPANLALYALPVSVPGGVVKRVVTGAGMNVGTGVAARAVEKAALGEEGAKFAQEPLDPARMSLEGTLGALFGGAFGSRARPKMSPAEASAQVGEALDRAGGEAPGAPPGPRRVFAKVPADEKIANLEASTEIENEIAQAMREGLGEARQDSPVARQELIRKLAFEDKAKDGEARPGTVAEAKQDFGAAPSKSRKSDAGGSVPPTVYRVVEEDGPLRDHWTTSKAEDALKIKERMEASDGVPRKIVALDGREIEAAGGEPQGKSPYGTGADWIKTEREVGPSAVMGEVTNEGAKEEVRTRATNVLDSLIPSETSSGHPAQKAWIASRLGVTPQEIGSAAAGIRERGFPRTDVERALVRMIAEGSHNRHAGVEESSGAARKADIPAGKTEREPALSLGGEPAFLRGPEAAREIVAAHAERLRTAVDERLSGWKNAPGVVWVRSASDLPFRAAPDAEGAFHGGRVYLVQENLRSTERAIRVLFHETAGHYGLRGLMGGRLDDLLGEVHAAWAGGKLSHDPYFDLRTIAETYGFDLGAREGRLRAAEEALARMAERGVETGFLDRLIVRLAAWMRQVFPGIKITRAEVRDLISRSRGWVERGEGGEAGLRQAADAAMASRLRETRVFVPDETFSWLGKKPGNVFADVEALYKKHPNQFSGPEDVLRHVEAVFDRPDIAMPATKQEYALLMRRNGPDRAVVVELELRGGKYRVISAYLVQGGQVEKKVMEEIESARREGGRTPQVLARPGVLPASISRLLPASRDTVQPSTDTSIGPRSSRVKPEGEPLLSRPGEPVPTSEAGGLRESYERRIADPVWRTAIRASEAVFGNRLLERIGMGLVDKAPPEFKQMLREYRVSMLKAGETAKAISEAGSAMMPEERKLISGYIEGELAAGVVPPKAVIENAAKMQVVLKAQADELSRLGMLSPDSRARWEGRYLPRFYARHILDNPFDKVLRSAVTKIEGSHLRGRGLFERIKVEDVPEWERLGWQVRYKPEGELKPGDTVAVWRDFTPEERARMGEIRDGIYRFTRGYMEIQKDIALGRLFESVSGSEFAKSVQPPGEGWVRVPDDTVPNTGGVRRFGALSGKWVPEDAWYHLKAVSGERTELEKAYLKGLSLWKEGKTALNPVVHGNNVVSNVVMADLAGVSPFAPRGLKLYREAWREYRTRGKLYQEAKDAGLFGAEFYAQELRGLLPELGEFASPDKFAAGWFSRTTEALARMGPRQYRQTMGRLYQAEDEFFKMLLYLDATRRGKTAAEGADWADRFIFNYADLPEGARKIKNTALPFFSYTIKAIPAIAYAAIHAPWRAAKWIALFGGANWYAYESLFGAGAADQEALERGVMPDFMRGYTWLGVPKNVRLPWQGDAGEARFLDISRRLPLGDIFDAQNQAGGIPALQPFMPNNPILNLLAGLVWNRDTFTGKEVVKGSDSAWGAAQEMAEWAYRQIAPNTPALPGSYSWNKVLEGAASALGEPVPLVPGVVEYSGRDRRGRQHSLPLALADTLTGTKVRTVDVDLERAQRVNEIQKQIRDLMAETRSIGRNQSLTPALRERQTRDVADRIAELSRQRAAIAGLGR